MLQIVTNRQNRQNRDKIATKLRLTQVSQTLIFACDNAPKKKIPDVGIPAERNGISRLADTCQTEYTMSSEERDHFTFAVEKAGRAA